MRLNIVGKKPALNVAKLTRDEMSRVKRVGKERECNTRIKSKRCEACPRESRKKGRGGGHPVRGLP